MSKVRHNAIRLFYILILLAWKLFIVEYQNNFCEFDYIGYTVFFNNSIEFHITVNQIMSQTKIISQSIYFKSSDEADEVNQFMFTVLNCLSKNLNANFYQTKFPTLILNEFHSLNICS